MRSTDKLPPTGETVDAVAIFPFGTGGDRLDSQSLAIAAKALEVVQQYRPKFLIILGGWPKHGPKESQLLRDYINDRLYELLPDPSQRPEVLSEDRSRDTFWQVWVIWRFKQYLQRQRKPLHRLLIVAQEVQFPRCMWTTQFYIRDVTTYGIGTAGERWDDNAKELLRDKTAFRVREEKVFRLYRIPCVAPLMTVFTYLTSLVKAE